MIKTHRIGSEEVKRSRESRGD